MTQMNQKSNNFSKSIVTFPTKTVMSYVVSNTFKNKSNLTSIVVMIKQFKTIIHLSATGTTH